MPFLLVNLYRHQSPYLNLLNLNKNFRFIHISSYLLKKSHYDILGIKINASSSQIKKAYFEKSKLYHPDRNVASSKTEKKKNEKLFLNVQKAYEVLGDPDTKEEYDKKTFGRVSSNYERKTPEKDIQESFTSFYKTRKKPLKRSREERMFELVERKDVEDFFAQRRATHEYFEDLNKQIKSEKKEENYAPIFLLLLMIIVFFIILL